MGSIKGSFPLVFFFVFSLLRLFPQDIARNNGAASLGTEISRLEALAKGPGTARGPSLEQYHAFLGLAGLYRLSGNADAALKSLEGALALFPGDGRLLAEQGRLLISIGENEKAALIVNTLLSYGQGHGSFPQGRYLGALLEAFGAGNTLPLASLAEESGFAQNRSQIYYTLWMLTGLQSWKTRLVSEFPRSPEAIIAGGGIGSAPTPLWLLSPGKDGFSGSAAQSAAGPPRQAAPGPARVLQAGLFSSEENAAAMVEQLKKAGFESVAYRRQVNGNDFWAAAVHFGADMNAMIAKLKNAGFESFPVTIP